MTEKERLRERKALAAVAIVGLVCLLAMIFPAYTVANRVEPCVLGLPFSMFWVVGWIAVEFVGLVAAYLWEYRGR